MLIKLLVRLSDFIISLFDNDKYSSENEEFNNFKEAANFSNKDIDKESDNIELNPLSKFKFSQIFQSEGIFEELEGKYGSPDIRAFKSQNETEIKNDFLSKLKAKLLQSLFKNRFFSINSSRDLFKLAIAMFLSIILLALLIDVIVSLEMAIAFIILMIMAVVLMVYYPKIKKENDYASFSKELPYALRQLSTELRSGKSLFDSLDSIADSDYGILSIEFARVLEEIKYGETTEDAFFNLEKRVGSAALSRVIYEILASLRIGSNLSNSLNIIAEDVNFDIRMNLKEYSEKLNAFIMIYTFLAILAPVIILTMLLAASVVIGDLVPPDLILILYSLFFPMIIVFLAFMIKRLEPKI